MIVILFSGTTSRSLEAKFRTINFQAHIINIKKLNESGTNESDVIIRALDVYRRTHKKNIILVHAFLANSQKSR